VPDALPATVKDESEFLSTARDRYARAQAAEEKIRRAANRDLRFLVSKQWEDEDLNARKDPATGRMNRPALTFNKLPPFVHQVTNEQRKNRPGAKVSPQGGPADQATADIYQGLIRHIEYSSQADVAYDTAFDYAVSSSFGYWRYTTEYVNRSTHQDIKIVRIKDPSCVRLDPDAEEPDCSDGMFAFVYRVMSREAFKRRYPASETAQSNFAPAGGFAAPEWLTGGDCIVAEYWQVELETKKLTMYRGIPAPPVPIAPAPAPAAQPLAPDADEEGYVTRGYYDDEEVPEGFEPDLDDDGDEVEREEEVRTVWRYDINGHELLDKPVKWAGRYIPIVPVYGDEKYVEGERFLTSVIRNALDPQQLYNFYKTTEAEVIQQTPKNPYIGAVGQFKTMAIHWAQAHIVPRAFMEYDPVQVGSQLAPPPARQQYEPATQALIAGAGAANEDIKSTTGLFDPSRGQATPNADSGVAIMQLQQQGETSTWHFFDNFLRSMWHGYRILLDLIPKIYDAPRVIRIVRPDDAEELVQINRLFTAPDGKRMKYDLAQGDYAIALSVQTSYATRRQQNVANLAQVAKADPAQLPLWADLFVKQLDLGPIGDQISERLTPPQYKTQDMADPQQMQQAAMALTQQNQMLQQQVTELSNVLATKSYETQAKTEQNQRDNQTKVLIATMQEETKRMSDAVRLAIAEISTKAQTGQRAMSDYMAGQVEREAMAHEQATAAATRALAIHDAVNMPPGMPGGMAPPPAAAPPQAQPGGGGPAGIPPGSVNPQALAGVADGSQQGSPDQGA
jgi:hypothetical protein